MAEVANETQVLPTEPETQQSEPLDLIKLCIDEIVVVKLRGSRELKGRLHAYDSHCNLVLSEVTETISEVVDESGATKKTTKTSEMMFVRGDTVVLISPPSGI